MENRLISILADVFGLREAEVHTGLTKDDVDSWDSLKQMDLVVSLEKEYQITLEISDILKMTAVKSIMEVLRSKGESFES
jgi:acyl carrier protein